MKREATKASARLVFDSAQPPPVGQAPRKEGLARDYARVARALSFILSRQETHPSLLEVAQHLDLSPSHLRRLFERWAGLSPKDFLDAVLLQKARQKLRQSASLLDVSCETGLSSPSRLHDLFVSHEAVSPGIYKSGGKGLQIFWGVHDSPFGCALALATPKGLSGLAFADDKRTARGDALHDMQKRLPHATYIESAEATASYVASTFGRGEDKEARIKLVLIGTAFQIRVWEALLTIPRGERRNYGGLGEEMGAGKRASRAVGRAVGQNPISYLVPCHRVLRRDGGLGGYHWGLVRKRVMLAYETAPERGGE